MSDADEIRRDRDAWRTLARQWIGYTIGLLGFIGFIIWKVI